MILKTLHPTHANKHQLEGGLWHSYGRHWLLEAIGAGDNDSLGAIIDHRHWNGSITRARKARVPTRWSLYARAWNLILPHITVQPPSTREEVMSMALYGGVILRKKHPLSRNKPLQYDEATIIGDVWDADKNQWRANLTEADQQLLTDSVSPRWTAILQQDPTPPARGHWILTAEPIVPSQQPHHPAIGAPHHVHGVLYYVHAVAMDRTYTLAEYMLGCLNVWIPIRTILTPLPTEHQLATVEPYQLKRDENWPANVTLVGPTATCWAASRGRLTWNDIIGYSPHGGHYVVNAKMATIRARWTHARGGRGPRPTDNAKELAAITEAHPTATVKRALHTLKMTDWLKPLKDFARACIGGFLPNGYACGQGHNGCPLCSQPNQSFSTHHEIAECAGMRFSREWLLEVSAHLLPVLSSSAIAAFVLYGLHARYHHDPVATALRECMFAQWRTTRWRALNRPTNASRQATRKQLNARLERAIYQSYTRQQGATFVARWRPYTSIGDDTPTIHGLPDPSRGHLAPPAR